MLLRAASIFIYACYGRQGSRPALAIAVDYHQCFAQKLKLLALQEIL